MSWYELTRKDEDNNLSFWRNKPEEKKGFERIPTHLDIKVLNGDSQHNGLVTNISEYGMYFISGMNLSSGLNIEVSIPFKNDNLKIPVNVIRTKKNGLYGGFGAKLSSPYQDYIDFVQSLKAPL